MGREEKGLQNKKNREMERGEILIVTGAELLRGRQRYLCSSLKVCGRGNGSRVTCRDGGNVVGRWIKG